MAEFAGHCPQHGRNGDGVAAGRGGGSAVGGGTAADTNLAAVATGDTRRVRVAQMVVVGNPLANAAAADA